MEHPHGVQPNLGLFEERGSAAPSVRSSGLGRLAALPDEALLNVLENLPAADLARLAAASKVLWVFCQHEELWKALCLEGLEGGWDFRGTWQDTYLCALLPGYAAGRRRARRVEGLQSDLLYTPWLCATVALDPAWLEVDNIERRSNLSLAEFQEQFELPNRPVILTDVVMQWPAMKRWTRRYLQRAFKGRRVLVGDQPISFDAYCRYADANRDELPLYLFDKTFAETAPQLAKDYSVPELFSDDLFSLLGEARPDYRWLIIGPHRSGSSWHKDPNSTSAWNGVVRGSKKWVLYPPHITPPGVRPSEDGADVASPVSLVEWFMSFYDHKASVGCAPMECILKAGEMLFVPCNWWHLAINLEESVAVTHNLVTPASLPHVLQHLRSRSPALVSGCVQGARSSLYDRFQAALAERRPELLEQLAAAAAAARKRSEEQHRLAGLFKEPAPADSAAGGSHPSSSAATAAGETAAGSGGAGGGGTAPAAASGGGFSFGFQV